MQKSVCVAVILIIFTTLFPGMLFAEYKNQRLMTGQEFEQAKRDQDRFHFLLRQGDVLAKQGKDREALVYFLEAYEFSKGSSSEAVAAGNLARFYEQIGEYEKSLDYVNWFLNGLNQGEPSWQRYMEMKVRLLKKMKSRA